MRFTLVDAGVPTASDKAPIELVLASDGRLRIGTLAVPERLEEFPDILQRIAAGERIDHYETQRQAKDGRVLSVSLTVSPIRDVSGRMHAGRCGSK